MKTIITSFLVIVLIAFPGCERDSDSPEVETFINQLISGQYESYELPDFSTEDIPSLLKYRNETTLITDFPRNPISSFWQPECKLGMMVLWTIESIRAEENGTANLIGRFPSQNPILALRDAPELHMVFSDQCQIEAARAYNDWWNSFHPFKDKIKIDPLAKTDYRWH
ncbi:DUF4943 domain-containing protein [bacterium]|nr:DUF4943 domain-containing protein [bacterium]